MGTARLVGAVLLVQAIVLPTTYADDTKQPGDTGLVVGKKMPFHVADFVSGENKDHCGCPAVMISNQGGSGLIIWSRDADTQSFQLAKALDALDSDKFQRFWIAFDADDKALAEK